MGIETRGIRPHLLRHGCATHILAGGARLKQVAELLEERLEAAAAGMH